MARAVFRVEVEWERISGKFAGRDEIVEQLLEWLENANEIQIDSVGSDGDSSYEVVDWVVSEEETKRKTKDT